MFNQKYLKEKIMDKIIASLILFVGLFLTAASMVFLPVLSLSFSLPLTMLGVVMITTPDNAAKSEPKN
jgi:hypothetical protein